MKGRTKESSSRIVSDAHTKQQQPEQQGKQGRRKERGRGRESHIHKEGDRRECERTREKVKVRTLDAKSGIQCGARDEKG